MNYDFFVGIDVSKSTVDVAVCCQQPEGQSIAHKQFKNDQAGMAKLGLWLSAIPAFEQQKSIFCMEATGIYCYPLIEYLQANNANIWVENAVQIKRSLGMVRGKNDKVDAIRIAQYAFRFNERIRLWRPLRDVVDKVKNLAALRHRLVDTQQRLLIPIEEMKAMGNIKMAAILERNIQKSLKAIDKDIEKIEAEIQSIIDADESLKNTFKLITSVVGIGFVTAVNLIVHTNEFKNINTARKLACYCGVAPFEYRSGSSIRGKTRVNNMANKKLKAYLHMASLTAVRYDPDLKHYYERKVAEGKHKLSVLNAVKCKLLSRVAAVVNNQQPYVKNI